MKFYRIEIYERNSISYSEVVKRENPYDYALIKEYKRFVHLNEDNSEPVAYLCKAHSFLQALEKANVYLEKLFLTSLSK